MGCMHLYQAFTCSTRRKAARLSVMLASQRCCSWRGTSTCAKAIARCMTAWQGGGAFPKRLCNKQTGCLTSSRQDTPGPPQKQEAVSCSFRQFLLQHCLGGRKETTQRESAKADGESICACLSWAVGMNKLHSRGDKL